MKTVFIAVTLRDSSVAEFFVAIANKYVQKYKVYIISYQSEKNNLDIDKGIELLEWPSRRPTHLRDFIYLFRQFRKNKPDIIISNFAAVNLCLLVGYLMRVKKRIAWYHTHSAAHLKESRFNRARKKYIYKLATRMITISKSAKHDLIEHYDVAENKISVIPNAVNKVNFQKNKKTEKKLIFIGRLHPYKGFDVFLKALPIILNKKPEYRIIVFGGKKDGSEIQTYRKKANDLGVLDFIDFRGFTSKEIVLKELSKSYACVVPSFFEAFCYVVIESFSVGTPVIGSNTTGIAEIIRDGVDGFLFEPGNYNELAKKVLELLDQEITRNRMGEMCYQRFLENYEIEKVVEKNFYLIE